MKNAYNGFIDLVVAGPDFSGTSTQLSTDIFHPDYDNGSIISHLKNKGYTVRDIRGTEFDALFHSEEFKNYNKDYMSLKEFLDDTGKSIYGNNPRIMLKDLDVKHIKSKMFDMIEGLNGYNKLTIASMVRNDRTAYIDPMSADVWVLEEPTYRGAGQVVRTVETNRSKFESETDQNSAALSLQSDRVNEYFRFRKQLRSHRRIILRSRSEESALYQIMDARYIRNGVSKQDFISYPGNKIAFKHPPTHIFIVCGPENWDKEEYIKLKSERTGRRVQDDFESNIDYQLNINNRYASNWLEELYSFAANAYKSTVPKIYRFSIYDSKETIRSKMCEKLDQILKEDFSDKVLD
ncbi:MAG TPA: hypothetical protein V6C58_06345 [Allocoleopsis sp.]